MNSRRPLHYHLHSNYITFFNRLLQEGYSIDHDGRCITIFSAPNYCDQVTHVHMCIYIYICTYILKYMHTHTHAHIIHACMHTYLHSYTQNYCSLYVTRKHTHTHTHTQQRLPTERVLTYMSHTNTQTHSRHISTCMHIHSNTLSHTAPPPLPPQRWATWEHLSDLDTSASQTLLHFQQQAEILESLLYGDSICVTHEDTNV